MCSMLLMMFCLMFIINGTSEHSITCNSYEVFMLLQENDLFDVSYQWDMTVLQEHEEIFKLQNYH